LLDLLAAARAVNAGEIARLCQDKGTIPAAVQQARQAAIEESVKRQRKECNA
jgi:hypothetical protein